MHLQSSDISTFKSIFDEAFFGHVPEDTAFLFFKWLLNGIDMMQLYDEEAKERTDCFAEIGKETPEISFDVNVLRMRVIANAHNETPSLLSTKSSSSSMDRKSFTSNDPGKDLVDRILDGIQQSAAEDKAKMNPEQSIANAPKKRINSQVLPALDAEEQDSFLSLKRSVSNISKEKNGISSRSKKNKFISREAKEDEELFGNKNKGCLKKNKVISREEKEEEELFGRKIEEASLEETSTNEIENDVPRVSPNDPRACCCGCCGDASSSNLVCSVTNKKTLLSCFPGSFPSGFRDQNYHPCVRCFDQNESGGFHGQVYSNRDKDRFTNFFVKKSSLCYFFSYFFLSKLLFSIFNFMKLRHLPRLWE